MQPFRSEVIKHYYYIATIVMHTLIGCWGGNNFFYYMALSHKDWELPNSRIWLAKSDIDRGLDFPIKTGI